MGLSYLLSNMALFHFHIRFKQKIHKLGESEYEAKFKNSYTRIFS